MDRQDIEVLHEKASDCYLRGDYLAALDLWRTLNNQAPEDERAQEGIRLCEMMSPEVSAADPPHLNMPSESGSSLAGEIEEDSDLEFDLDTSILEEMQDPATNAEPGSPTEDDVEDVIQQLDSIPDSPINVAAMAELEKRQNELLTQAQAAYDERRVEDARGILARLFILDENHQGAHALVALMDEQSSQRTFEIEDKLAEAVQWIEQGKLDEAESNLRKVLDLSPDHQEAEHYLDQTLQLMEEQELQKESAGTDSGDDLLLGNLDIEPATEADVSPEDAALSHGAVELDSSDGDDIELGGSAPGTDTNTVRASRGTGPTAGTRERSGKRCGCVCQASCRGWRWPQDQCFGGDPCDRSCGCRPVPEKGSLQRRFSRQRC